jgi:hypothetical protein
VFCFQFNSFHVKGQDISLEERLKGKDRVEDIMEIVESYYKEKGEFETEGDRDDEWKQWARWGLYMSARTDDQGRVVDVSKRTREAYSNYHPSQRSSTGNWIPRGPTSVSGPYGNAGGLGRVDRIAFDPTDANTIYAGTPSGGLFKSTTGGSSWTAITDNIPSLGISGIVVSFADPDVIYILTGDGDSSGGGLVVGSGYWRASAGVFVSYDGGTNWKQTAPLPISVAYAGYNLAQSPTDENTLLAATTEGIFRTTNGGGSWTEELTGATYEVKFKPGSGTIAYATQYGAFFRSSNGGATWTEITDMGGYPLQNGRVAMAVTNANSAFVYLFSGWAPASEVDNCGDDPSFVFGGIYRSTDNGTSFERQTNFPNLVESCCDGYNSRSQSNYDLALAASHANANILISGGILAWRSINAGVNWANVSADVCDPESSSSGYVHTDIHDIEYNPLNGYLYLSCDGGLMRSTNNGTDWISISSGLASAEAYHLAGSLTDIDNMIIGCQDNGCKRRNGNTSQWDPAAGGDGFDCIYNWDSSTSGYMTSNSTVYRFWNNGSDHVGITPVSDKFFWRVCSNTNDPSLVFAGCNDIYKSANSGGNWSNKGASGWWDIERCPSNENRLYAAGGNSAFATTGSMYFSSDMGDTWTVVSTNPGYPSGSIRLTDIDVRPNNSGYVWITFGGFSSGNKVFFSSTAGNSWVNKSGTLPNVPVNAIQVDANNNVYIGTDLGVFYLGANSSDWVPFWNRLPRIPVTDLELYEADNIIRASTFGRGVWESDTYTTCVQGYNLTATISGNRFYEASDSIACTSLISGGQNTKLIFKAADYIILKTGFTAPINNTVHIYTAPCGTAQNGD